jgi:hypothetical protein
MSIVLYALESFINVTVLAPYIDEPNALIFNVVIVIDVDKTIGGIE